MILSERRRRLPRLHLSGPYLALLDTLTTSARLPVTRARLALTYLQHLNRLLSAEGGKEGAEEEPDRLMHHLGEMAVQFHWSARYRCRVHCLVAHALRALGSPRLAAALEELRGRRREDVADEHVVTVEACRSQVRRFSLQGCLPLGLRRGASSPERQLLLWLAGEVLDQLRSCSRPHVQRIMRLLHRVIHQTAPNLFVGGLGHHHRISRLRSLSALDWLERYARAHPPGHHLGFHLLKTHLRILGCVHSRVLNPTARVVIPVPSSGGRLGGGGVQSSFSSSGSTEWDERLGQERQAVRAAVAELRHRLCRGGSGQQQRTNTTFTPPEVHELLSRAESGVERLILLLFLTTGLRIGGLCRLVAGTGPYASGREVPATLLTTEKNGRERVVALSPAVRILVAAWYRDGRAGPAGCGWLFPGPLGRPRSTTWAWRLCKQLFRRAGLVGGHVHPHTFRHTFVHVLFMNGLPFDRIAKIIGHSNAAITSGVYGRLRQTDLCGPGMLPWMPPQQEGGPSQSNEWVELAQRLRNPWHFSGPDWDELMMPSGRNNRRHSQQRESALARTRLAQQQQHNNAC